MQEGSFLSKASQKTKNDFDGETGFQPHQSFNKQIHMKPTYDKLKRVRYVYETESQMENNFSFFNRAI